METIQITVQSSEEAEALKKLLKSMSFVESVNSIDADSEREAWLKFSDTNFAAMYEEDKAEYHKDMIVKSNPDYKP